MNRGAFVFRPPGWPSSNSTEYSEEPVEVDSQGDPSKLEKGLYRQVLREIDTDQWPFPANELRRAGVRNGK